MDRFELIMEKMSEMSEEQLNSLIDMQKKRICVCRSCPTYDQCMTEGKSQCEVDPAECICSTCPAHDNFQLKHELYCLKGSEEEQRGKS